MSSKVSWKVLRTVRSERSLICVPQIGNAGSFFTDLKKAQINLNTDQFSSPHSLAHGSEPFGASSWRVADQVVQSLRARVRPQWRHWAMQSQSSPSPYHPSVHRRTTCTPARGPALWEDCGDAQMVDVAQIEPDWDLAAQPASDYEVDQRVNWLNFLSVSAVFVMPCLAPIPRRPPGTRVC